MGINFVWNYLKERGIDKDDIDELGLQIVLARDLISEARGTTNSFQDSRLAIVFPHYNTDGSPIDWWSARLVDSGVRPQAPTTFASSLEQRKLGKMFCPPNEPPHAYLVPTLDWRKLKKGDKIYIHESCIKAANGAKLGYYSIGLNGVRGWSSRKHNIALVDELKSLPWRALKLQPVIVFDSNAEDNWDVQHAIASLAAKLHEVTGQHAKHILLPRNPDGSHWGFDDFVVTMGSEAAQEYLEQEGEEVEISELEMYKMRLNEEVCVVRSLGRIAEQDTGTLMTSQTFTNINYATYMAPIEDKMVSAPRLWLQDSRRTEVESLSYMPGGDKIHNGHLNLWRGMGVEPSPGDPSPWLELLEDNVRDKGLRDWILKWMAYPLQNLGAKQNTYMHVWGPPGMGKQAFLAPMMKIYGKNAIIISKREIESSFNSVYANKQFINLDEIHGGNEKEALTITNTIKKFTTDETMVVNMKGQPEYVVPNCANLVTTSNYLDSIKLDEDDRRCAVVRWGHKGETPRGREYWEKFWNWAGAEGASIVYSFLLNYDTSDYDHKGWAPMSEDKKEMTASTMTREQVWVRELAEDPNQVLPPICKSWQLATTAQLAQYCFGEDPAGVTSHKKNTLGIRLNEADFSRVELKVEGRKERFWIIRGKDQEWTPASARAHLKTIKFPKV